MILSLGQFILTIVLTVFCINTLSLSHGEIPVFSLLIPALWVLPQQRVLSCVLLLSGIAGYGYTLAEQPLTLSVCFLTLFPMLQVMFSKRSSIAVMITISGIVAMLLMGIIFNQNSGKLDGLGWLSLMQAFSICAIWWSRRGWQGSGLPYFQKHNFKKHSWWPFALLLPLWLADLPHAVLICLAITGIVALMAVLDKARSNINWNKLLCWTLPSVSFTFLVVNPSIEVPSSVFVVWITMLGTAWMTDYILRSVEEEDIHL